MYFFQAPPLSTVPQVEMTLCYLSMISRGKCPSRVYVYRVMMKPSNAATNMIYLLSVNMRFMTLTALKFH
jgi:hypothetical protein